MLKGLGGGGSAVVVGRLATFNTFRPGDILAAEMSTPFMLKEILQAAAVVTDQGGPLCHAAVVCTEFRIPFVVGLQTVTEMQMGCTVRVDPKAGTVEEVKDGGTV